MLSAAAALLLCASGALLVRNLQVVRELNESRRERTTLSQRVTDLEQQLKNQEAAHADVVDELERVRTLQPVVQQPVGIRPSDRPVAPALTTIALALSPMTRSAEAVATLTIPPGTERVAFDLRLESNEFVLYRAALRDPATGLIAWRSNEVKAPPILESRSLPIVTTSSDTSRWSRSSSAMTPGRCSLTAPRRRASKRIRTRRCCPTRSGIAPWQILRGFMPRLPARCG